MEFIFPLRITDLNLIKKHRVNAWRSKEDFPYLKTATAVSSLPT